MARKHSSSWIRRNKRHAIYRRDDCRCIYCGIEVVIGAHVSNPKAATLDHIKAVDLGGLNKASNLVTACAHCNVAKSNLAMTAWIHVIAEAAGGNLQEELKQVRNRVRRHTRRNWKQYKETK